MKNHMADYQYCSNDDVLTAVDVFFDKEDEKFFANEIQELWPEWKKRVDRKGDYLLN